MKKFKKMNKKELSDELEKTREELYEAQFNVRVGKQKDYAQIKTYKKDIARILTLLNQHKEKKEVKDTEKEKEVKKKKKKSKKKKSKNKKKKK